MIRRSSLLALPLLVLASACIIVVDEQGNLSRACLDEDHDHDHLHVHGSTVRGSGVAATEQRTVGEFRRVAVMGSADVDVRIGTPASVSVTGDDNLVSWVTTEIVEDGALRIGMRSGSYSTRTRLAVTVTAPAIESISLSGSSDVSVTSLTGEAFSVFSNGSGNVRATGRVDRLEATLSGSGDLALDGLEAREIRVSSAGSGDVELGTAETLVVSMAGSGDVTYRGDPKLTKSDAGSGELIRR